MALVHELFDTPSYVGEIVVIGCSVPRKGLLDWRICDVWSYGRLVSANRLGTDDGAGGDFGSVIVRE